MKRIIILILMFTLLLSVSVFAHDTETGFSEYINNEIYVMYSDGTSEVKYFCDENEFYEITDELSKNNNVLLYQPNYSYNTNALSVSDSLLSRQWALSNDGTFYMEEQKNEFPVFDMPFGDVKMPGQWQLPDNFGRPGGGFRKYGFNPFFSEDSYITAKEGIDINLEDAWNTYSDNSKEVIVAIVDTGIDYTHEDLKGRIWTNDDEIANNGIDDDANGFTDDVYGWNFYNNSNNIYNGSEDDHGTHGAGTIAAKADNITGIAGIAQSDNIKIMSVKALGGQSGDGSTSSVIRAIQYAEANGASICNLSLGSQINDPALYQAIANSNMLFVVAAGNDGADTDRSPSYPSSYDLENIISVANLNYDGSLAYSSNYGENSVDIAAPGSYILSTTTDNSYSYMSGTSMAAPMVSAAAALIYSHYDNITLANVKEILLSSAKKLENLENTSQTDGMLDVGSALSFDLNALSADEWEIKTPTEYNGTAPEIGVYITQGLRTSFLILRVYDEDDDLSYVSYATGEQTSDYFAEGNEETKITLDKNSTAIFEAKAGTYTFYAVDSEGNESVKIITMTEKNRNMDYFMRSFFPWF